MWTVLEIIANPSTYLANGDADKPTICRPECECYRCEEWRKNNIGMNRQEVRTMQVKMEEARKEGAKQAVAGRKDERLPGWLGRKAVNELLKVLGEVVQVYAPTSKSRIRAVR